MTRYIVLQDRSYKFYQEVEASNKWQAISIAEKRGEWEHSDLQDDIVYNYEVNEIGSKEEL